ncbi:MAG: [Fe-Fe] hydrogenase large subunit C-terminal domain-containing protein [Christensenellaceae bacterium]
MNEYLKLKSLNCKHCYKCIRQCPVKAIGFSSGQANIVQDECILCGHCFVGCPQNAKVIRPDIDKAKELIAGEAPVYASIAPAFLANYPGVSFAALKSALLSLGFADAFETAEGATMVKRLYDEMAESASQSVIISSCCPSVNMLIQKYYPEALACLAAVKSPMQAHCSAIKEHYANAKTVFIGPCISKKAEADQYPNAVDCVLTFDELATWLGKNNLQLFADTSAEKAGRARFFPTSGGILKSMDKHNQKYRYLVVDGVDNCVRAIKDILNGSLRQCFIEMSACAGSCVGGPAMNRVGAVLSNTIEVCERTAAGDDFEVAQPAHEKLYQKITPLLLKKPMPSESAIKEILAKIGKTKPEHELNCGSCGYETCRDKAAAVIEGKAELSMCLPYLSEKAQSFSETIVNNSPNGIIVLNDMLEIQQINTAACEMFNIRNEKDVLHRNVVCILDPVPFVEAVEDGKSIFEERVYLAEYGKYIMQTIVYDKSYRVAIGFMRDVTEKIQGRIQKEERNGKAIEITDKVIAKQMRTVQEIASLLGETTAETKVALTRLKETLIDE